MDPRFRRNHQLHLLLKKRTYVSDHELYEMMRSKQVYKAQNELRRELERRLQEIKLDQKVRVASFMVQRATFIKLMAAREKGRRRLLNVKKLVGGELSAKEDDDIKVKNLIDCDEGFEDTSALTIKKQEYLLHVYSSFVDGDDRLDLNETSKLSSYQEQNALNVVQQSVNKEWMEDVSKRRIEKKNSSKLKDKKLDHSQPNLVHNVTKNTVPKSTTNENVLEGSFPRDKTVERISNKSNNREDAPKRVSKKGELSLMGTKSENKNIEITAKKHGKLRDTEVAESSETKGTKIHRSKETVKHDDISINLPGIEIPSDECDKKLNDSTSNNSTTNPRSKQRLLGPFPPIPSRCGSSSYLDVPSAAHYHPNKCHPKSTRERERSVTMLFVEEDEEGNDGEESSYLHQVSQFDIEALTKYSRRKRGYSIVISSTDLHHEVENDNQHCEEVKKNDKKQTRMITKHPHHPSSWGVKVSEDKSPRQRSKLWYQNFMKTKINSKKRHDTPVLRTSQGLDKKEDSFYEHSHQDHRPHLHHRYNYETEEEICSARKTPTPSSSDSNQSPEELMCRLKLQRLKLHCQLLSRRVALFVSS